MNGHKVWMTPAVAYEKYRFVPKSNRTDTFKFLLSCPDGTLAEPETNRDLNFKRRKREKIAPSHASENFRSLLIVN